MTPLDPAAAEAAEKRKAAQKAAADKRREQMEALKVREREREREMSTERVLTVAEARPCPEGRDGDRSEHCERRTHGVVGQADQGSSSCLGTVTACGSSHEGPSLP